MSTLEEYRRYIAHLEAMRDTQGRTILRVITCAKLADAAIAELEEDREKLSDDLFTALTRAEQAEAALAEVRDLGHNDDCLFCALKDRVVDRYDAEVKP